MFQVIELFFMSRQVGWSFTGLAFLIVRPSSSVKGINGCSVQALTTCFIKHFRVFVQAIDTSLI